jgi:hypothetical protein
LSSARVDPSVDVTVVPIIRSFSFLCRIGGRAVATTLRPRSGKEYYKIDRSILVEQGRGIGSSSNYANVTPFIRKETHRHPIT